MSGIFWLASYPKSGNTWLRVFLTNYWRDADTPADINELEQTPIAGDRRIFDSYSGVDSGDLTPAEITRLRPAVYRAFAADATRDARFWKVHDAYGTLPDGCPLFPPDCTAGAIYILRNPLDVAVSYASHNNRSVEWAVEQMRDPWHELGIKPNGIAEQLPQRLLTWSDHVESWMCVTTFPVCLIRYEDMVSDPAAAFSRAIRFIGADADPTRVEKAIRFSAFEELRRQEQDGGFRESILRQPFFRKGKVGAWRERLSDTLAARIVRDHGEIMRKYGYLNGDDQLVY